MREKTRLGRPVVGLRLRSTRAFGCCASRLSRLLFPVELDSSRRCGSGAQCRRPCPSSGARPARSCAARRSTSCAHRRSAISMASQPSTMTVTRDASSQSRGARGSGRGTRRFRARCRDQRADDAADFWRRRVRGHADDGDVRGHDAVLLRDPRRDDVGAILGALSPAGRSGRGAAVGC